MCYTTTQAGFASIFNNFLFAYIYAKKLKKSLYVYDKNSPLGLNYSILKETFVKPSDIEYTTDANKEKIPSSRILSLLLTIPTDILQKHAKNLFQLTPSMLSRIQTECSKYSFPTFDLGVHIRSGDKITTGEMSEIPIDYYVKEINTISRGNVFVMTDNIRLLTDLKEKINEGIHLYSLDSQSPCQEGHDQSVFNLSTDTVKMNAFIQFMTEIFYMQQIPKIICTFSSNIGRYLYLTNPTATFKSLDMKLFIPM